MSFQFFYLYPHLAPQEITTGDPYCVTVSIEAQMTITLSIPRLSCDTMYHEQEIMKLQATFKGSDGLVVDPVTILFTIIAPDGTVTSYTYGVDAELVRDSEGVYYVLYMPPDPGPYIYYFKGIGTDYTKIESSKFYAQDVPVALETI